MARDHARIRLDIWADDDFRDLPALSQWLYFHLVTHPDLSFCGVTDWRPARIAAVTAELAAHDVEYAASFLEDCSEHPPFVVIDRDSEETLIRSWVKHDGLVSSPNLTKALVKSYAGTASSTLRAVLVGQLLTLKRNKPNLVGWEHLRETLKRRSMTAEEGVQTLPPNPSANPSPNPSGETSGNPSHDPSVTPFSVLRAPNSEQIQKGTLKSHQELQLEVQP